MFVCRCKQGRRCCEIFILIYVAAASARCGNSKPFRKSEILMTLFSAAQNPVEQLRSCFPELSETFHG